MVENSLGYSAIFLPPCKLHNLKTVWFLKMSSWLPAVLDSFWRAILSIDSEHKSEGNSEELTELLCNLPPQAAWLNNGPILDNKQLIVCGLGLVLKGCPECRFWAQNWRKQQGTHWVTLQSSCYKQMVAYKLDLVLCAWCFLGSHNSTNYSMWGNTWCCLHITWGGKIEESATTGPHPLPTTQVSSLKHITHETVCFSQSDVEGLK